MRSPGAWIAAASLRVATRATRDSKIIDLGPGRAVMFEPRLALRAGAITPRFLQHVFADRKPGAGCCS